MGLRRRGSLRPRRPCRHARGAALARRCSHPGGGDGRAGACDVTPLRADAQRNLSRVLDAAAAAFTDRGPDVSVDEIARRAGVGHATVFRRFPTKEALLAAVVEEHVDALLALARAALDQSN